MRGLLTMAALGGAAYWASKQPGGIKGTIDRARQGFRDIMAGQDPRQVGKRFMSGRDEEPAGYYTEEPTVTTEQQTFQQPYRDQVSTGF
ncbi:MAG: hypothetical protein ACK47B_21860 [Armatimonadota bacterium]